MATLLDVVTHESLQAERAQIQTQLDAMAMNPEQALERIRWKLHVGARLTHLELFWAMGAAAATDCITVTPPEPRPAPRGRGSPPAPESFDIWRAAR